MTPEQCENHADLIISIRNDHHFSLISPETDALTAGARALRVLNIIHDLVIKNPPGAFVKIRNVLEDPNSGDPPKPEYIETERARMCGCGFVHKISERCGPW